MSAAGLHEERREPPCLLVCPLPASQDPGPDRGDYSAGCPQIHAGHCAGLGHTHAYFKPVSWKAHGRSRGCLTISSPGSLTPCPKELQGKWAPQQKPCCMWVGAAPAAPTTLDPSQELTAPWQACGWLANTTVPPCGPWAEAETVPTLYHEVCEAFLSCGVSS